MTPTRSSYYNKQNLWSLYLMCAFPLFFWTLLLAFRDISWLTERTNAWDAIGAAAYGMVFALIESLVIFAATVLLGFLVSRCWSSERRTALMSVLILILSLWAIFTQSYFVWNFPIPAFFARFLISTERPILTMYLIFLALVFLSISIPAYLILHSEKSLKAAQGLMDRISTLTLLYLIISLVGLIIIATRNL